MIARRASIERNGVTVTARLPRLAPHLPLLVLCLVPVVASIIAISTRSLGIAVAKKNAVVPHPQVGPVDAIVRNAALRLLAPVAVPSKEIGGKSLKECNLDSMNPNYFYF